MGTEPKEIDVRIIAATNKRIEERVASKLFREDLYYRINVVPIYIPPLRERREDILPLIFYFLAKFKKIHQKEKELSPEVVDVLCKYDFPGNVRELSNLIERLVVVTERKRIEKKDLPSFIPENASKFYYLSSEIPPLKEALKKYEAFIIEKALKRYGSQKEAAKVLGVDQTTISRKLKKQSISKSYANIPK